MNRAALLFLSVFLGVWFGPLASLDAQQLVVEDPVRWGFDGVPVYGAFNLLTIRVRNEGERPFRGTLSLGSRLGLSQVGVPQARSLYLSGNSTQRIQFVAYLSAPSQSWSLTWSGGGSHTLTVPRQHGDGAAVLLVPEDERWEVPPGVRVFPQSAFPTRTAALDTLRSLAIATTPEWNPAQQRALLRWLRRGGRLSILADSSGSWPALSGDLAQLTPAGGMPTAAPPIDDDSVATSYWRAEFGWGEIRWYRESRREVTPEIVAGERKADPRLSTRNVDSLPDMNRFVSQQLARLSAANVNWPWIFFLGVLYLILIVPGTALLQFATGDYRIAIAGFVGCVALFSWVFLQVGSRGFGERAAAYSIAYARQTEPGQYDVAQWCHAFVTKGGEYVFAPTGDDEATAMPLCDEGVEGWVDERSGAIALDIPVFSARNFFRRAQLPGPTLIERVMECEPKLGVPPTFRARVTSDYPSNADAWIYYGGRFFRVDLDRELGELVARPERRADVYQPQRFAHVSTLDFGFQRANSPREKTERWRNEVLAGCIDPVLAWSVDLKQIVQPGLPHRAEAIDLFVLAPIPKSMQVKSRLAAEPGRVLYHFSCAPTTADD